MSKYVPLLKSKDAEYIAWCTSTATARSNSRVIYEVLPSLGIANFVTRLSRRWPTGDVATVDVSYIQPAAGTVRHASDAMFARQIPMKPVIHLDDAQPVLAEIAYAAASHQQGACLRLGSDVADPDTRKAGLQLPAILATTGLGTTEIDLVLDYREVASARDVNRVAPLAVADIAWAAANGQWRSVTIASGAFPAAISNLPTSTSTPVTRFDALLYGEVMQRNPVLVPDYGDYAIQHPSLPRPGRAPLPNLRYTSATEWQVFREERLLPGNESFFTVCARAVASPHWAGANYSAGDREIERCSRSQGGAGRATEWLAWGASHHIAHVVDRLATLGVP